MQKSKKQQLYKRQSRVCKLRYLIHAIKCQDEDYIDNVTTKNFNINENYFDDGTPLHVAARIGNYQIFQKLIKMGADIHQRHPITQEIVLDSAMESPNYDIVTYLKENGVENSDCINGKIALQFAADEGTKEFMTLLLTNKPGINAEYFDYLTSFSDAILVRYHAEISAVFVKFVLDLFCTYEGDRITKTIFHAAADINKYTALKTWLMSFSRKFDFSKNINCFSYFTRTMRRHNDLQHHTIAESDSTFQNYTNVTYGMDSIKRHIVELLAAGFYVSDRNIETVCNARIFDGYLAECSLEVEKMKKNVIEDSNITFMEILQKNVRYLTHYLKTVDLKKILRCEPQFLLEYPIYNRKIGLKLWKVQIRNNYLKDSEEVIYNIFYELQLPYTFIRELFFCLSNDDLKEIAQPSR